MPTEELAFLPITELSKRIEAKKLSPVDLTQYFLDRSQKLGPRYNAYALLTPEIAMAQAKAAEKEIQRGHYRGPLHGIPYAAKDLLAVKGVPCTWGAKPYATQVFNYDATVIEHLNRVGAVLAPFAIGTETWGSILCPSAFCGVSGLRPTYGRVSRYGAMALSPSMDKIGPLARSAEDCARVFAAMAGHDPRDRSTLPLDKAAFTYSPSIELKSRALKIGWLTNAWKKPESGVAKAADAAEKVVKKYFPGASAN